MVWQRLRKYSIIVCLSLFIAFGYSATAHATTYTPYYDGNISSTYLTIFRDIVADLPVNQSYVFFRSGRYDYTLFAGDLKCTDTSFYGMSTDTQVTKYNISTNTNTGSYAYSVDTETNFSLNATNYLVYSNLGNYPRLEERSVDYAFCSLIVISVVALCMLMRPLFAFVLRFRGSRNIS